MKGAGAREEESCSARVEIVNEFEQREEETSLVCTCDSQPFLCELCDCSWEAEAVVRKRVRGVGQEAGQGAGQGEGLHTSDYTAGQKKGGWVETDPETTQTFRRLTGGLLARFTNSAVPDTISREEAWKLYIKKLQDEANYLLNTPDTTEICCCAECIAEYELQCNEVLGWRRRSPTVEGFTKEVNTLCDPSLSSVLHTIVQDKYKALPCNIM